MLQDVYFREGQGYQAVYIENEYEEDELAGVIVRHGADWRYFGRYQELLPHQGAMARGIGEYRLQIRFMIRDRLQRAQLAYPHP